MVKLEKVKLDNGLNIYFLLDNSKHTTYINLIVKYGGINNIYYINNKKIKDPNGMAHLIEHTVLESNIYGDLMKIFGENMGRSNGLTSIDRTQFYVDTTSDIEKNIELLIKGIHSPIINDEILTNIKMPIIEEKRRSLDNKNNLLYNKSIESITNNKNYTSILGDVKEINSINSKQVLRSFKAFYKPSNEILIISGKFDKNSVLSTIKKAYESLSFEDNNISLKEFKNRVINKMYIVKSNTGINKSLITFKLDTKNYSSYDKIKIDLYIYSFLRMNFGIVSNMSNSLINENIISKGINFSSSLFEDNNIFQIEADTNNNDLFENKIINYFKNKEYIFDKDLFELYKKNYILDLIVRNDNIYNITDPFIENIITYKYDELDKVKDIENLNFDEFKDLISSLSFDKYTIGRLTN